MFGLNRSWSMGNVDGASWIIGFTILVLLVVLVWAVVKYRNRNQRSNHQKK